MTGQAKPDGRYSTPPTAEKLVSSTTRLTASLDVLERRVGSEPMPAAVAIAALDLTDEQRVAVCLELRREYGSLPHVVSQYEAEAKARLRR